MGAIGDYLAWRGDVSFSKDQLNEIDSLVFSILVYGELLSIVPSKIGEGLPLREVARLHARFLSEQDEEPEPIGFFGEVPKLLQEVAETKRFSKVRLSGFEKQIDFDHSKQFVAMVISLSPRLHVIAFRGTDTNLAGWKEDLLMSFMDEIPAQQQAARFATEVFDALEGEFILTGHSKGGNLAIYAALKAPGEHQARIVAIHNHDGPGFHHDMIMSDSYQRIVSKIKTFIPRSSLVGMLLEHGGEYVVVNSRQKSLLQHDPFSWEVMGPHFMPADGMSKTIVAISEAIRTWLGQVGKEDRAQFVHAFCDLIEATGAQTLEELTSEKLQSVQAVVKAYAHMDKDARAHLKEVLDIFFAESRKSIRDTLRGELGHLFSIKRPTKRQNSDESASRES